MHEDVGEIYMLLIKVKCAKGIAVLADDLNGARERYYVQINYSEYEKPAKWLGKAGKTERTALTGGPAPMWNDMMCFRCPMVQVDTVLRIALIAVCTSVDGVETTEEKLGDCKFLFKAHRISRMSGFSALFRKPHSSSYRKRVVDPSAQLDVVEGRAVKEVGAQVELVIECVTPRGVFGAASALTELEETIQNERAAAAAALEEATAGAAAAAAAVAGAGEASAELAQQAAALAAAQQQLAQQTAALTAAEGAVEAERAAAAAALRQLAQQGEALGAAEGAAAAAALAAATAATDIGASEALASAEQRAAERTAQLAAVSEAAAAEHAALSNELAEAEKAAVKKSKAATVESAAALDAARSAFESELETLRAELDSAQSAAGVAQTSAAAAATQREKRNAALAQELAEARAAIAADRAVLIASTEAARDASAQAATEAGTVTLRREASALRARLAVAESSAAAARGATERELAAAAAVARAEHAALSKARDVAERRAAKLLERCSDLSSKLRSAGSKAGAGGKTQKSKPKSKPKQKQQQQQSEGGGGGAAPFVVETCDSLDALRRNRNSSTSRGVGRCDASLLLDASLALAREVCAARAENGNNVVHVLLELEARQLLPSRFCAELARRAIELAAHAPSAHRNPDKVKRGRWSDAELRAAAELVLEERSSDSASPLDLVEACSRPLAELLKNIVAAHAKRERGDGAHAAKLAAAIGAKAARAAAAAATQASVAARRTRARDGAALFAHSGASSKAAKAPKPPLSVAQEMARLEEQLADPELSSASKHGLTRRYKIMLAEARSAVPGSHPPTFCHAPSPTTRPLPAESRNGSGRVVVSPLNEARQAMAFT